MTPNHCTTSLGCVFVWWRAPKNCIAHHLALPSSFCFATARSNEQNHTEQPMSAATSCELPDVSRRVLQLQVLTIVWMTVEAVVSLGSAWSSHSPALFAFGGDSLIELLSAAVVFWRFRFELNEARAALKADAAESALCGYMAWIALAGLMINAIGGKSWADPVAAVALTPLVLREGWIAVHSSKLACDCCTT